MTSNIFKNWRIVVFMHSEQSLEIVIIWWRSSPLLHNISVDTLYYNIKKTVTIYIVLAYHKKFNNKLQINFTFLFCDTFIKCFQQLHIYVSFKQVFNHDCKHDRFTSIFLHVKKPIWKLICLVNQYLTKIIKMQLPMQFIIIINVWQMSVILC